MPRKMTNAAFCAMACNEGAFHRFLDEEFGEPVANNLEAADVVRKLLGIQSRRDLDANDMSARRWHDLKAQYDNWLRS